MKLNGNFQNLEQSYLFVTIAKKVAESMDSYMKSLPADTAPDPYADIPVFSTPTSDVLAKQGI